MINAYTIEFIFVNSSISCFMTVGMLTCLFQGSIMPESAWKSSR